MAFSVGERPAARRTFVIMAFSDDLEDVYELGIKETLHKAGFQVSRSDSSYHGGLIIQEIYEQIHQSHVLITELTYERPNCYYELGFAHALAG